MLVGGRPGAAIQEAGEALHKQTGSSVSSLNGAAANSNRKPGELATIISCDCGAHACAHTVCAGAALALNACPAQPTTELPQPQPAAHLAQPVHVSSTAKLEGVKQADHAERLVKHIACGRRKFANKSE